MDMVPLILFPLPAGTMLNSVSRGRERDIAENTSFSASWVLGVGSAGSCRNAAASTSSSSAHMASSVPSNCSTRSLLASGICHCTLARTFSGQLLPSGPQQAVLQQSASSETLLYEISVTGDCIQASPRGKTCSKFCLCSSSQVTAHGCSEARPCFLHHGLNLSLGGGLFLGCSISPWSCGYSWYLLCLNSPEFCLLPTSQSTGMLTSCYS